MVPHSYSALALASTTRPARTHGEQGGGLGSLAMGHALGVLRWGTCRVVQNGATSSEVAELQMLLSDPANIAAWDGRAGGQAYNDTSIQGYRGTRNHTYMATRIQAYKDIPMHTYKDTRIQGHKDERIQLQGYKHIYWSQASR